MCDIHSSRSMPSDALLLLLLLERGTLEVGRSGSIGSRARWTRFLTAVVEGTAAARWQELSRGALRRCSVRICTSLDNEVVRPVRRKRGRRFAGPLKGVSCTGQTPFGQAHREARTA